MLGSSGIFNHKRYTLKIIPVRHYVAVKRVLIHKFLLLLVELQFPFCMATLCRSSHIVFGPS